jgi:hypothetical protein
MKDREKSENDGKKERVWGTRKKIYRKIKLLCYSKLSFNVGAAVVKMSTQSNTK